MLVKIGKPDSDFFFNDTATTETTKRWIYLPTQGDSQTLTTVVIRNGKVIEVTRQVSR